MKQSIVILLFALVASFAPNQASAQRHEFGLSFGSMNYSGELSRRPQPREAGIGGYAIYHYNLSNPLGWRSQFGIGWIRASDDANFDPLTQNRSESFNANIYELSTGLEYHFLDYRPRDSHIRVSPYLFGGVGGIFYTSDAETSGLVPIIPLGIGFKWKLLVELDIGIEYTARKTFTDLLDGLADASFSSVKDFQYGNDSTDDWYHFVGITLSYRLYSIPCPQDFEKPYYRQALEP